MPKETMNSKERWTAVMKRQKPDRIPMDYWATPEVNEKLMKHLGLSSMEEVFKKLHIDKPVGVGPKYTGPALTKGTDMFGVTYRTVGYGTGAYDERVTSPLAKFETAAEIEKNYKWPSADWWDYSVIPGQIKGKEDRPIVGGGSEPFLTYKNLRGEEQAFIDLVADPEMVNYILGKLYGLAYENTKSIYEAIPGKVFYSYVAEDMGSQEDLMYSPDQISTFFFPHMRKMIKLVHGAGAYTFHHSDGGIRKIIPGLIEIGMDILNPIQWRCRGMEREGLKKDFGDKLVFHSGVDNQQTIPFGTIKDVKDEVKTNIEILGRNGGYILGPCHNIQPVTSAENIVALYEAGMEFGFTK